MSVWMIISVVFVVVIVLVLAGIVILKKPKKLKTQKFIAHWKKLQAKLVNPAEWATVLIEADKMLDLALKKRKLKGKSMGERLVSAQRLFSNNDDVWFAHNLAKKVASSQDIKLKESDVKEALLGFRNALKDIGALQFKIRDSKTPSLHNKK